MITETKKRNIVHGFIIGTFVMLYGITSLISTIHVVEFFELSNPTWLAISLAIAFEIGAAASLAALIVLDKTNKSLVWFLFIVLSSFQMMGNSFYAYMHLENFQGWIDLFGLNDYEFIEQKRILSIISGAVLPLVALGFIKSLVDYIRPDVEDLANEYDDSIPNPIDDKTYNTTIGISVNDKKESVIEEPTVDAITLDDIDELIDKVETPAKTLPELPKENLQYMMENGKKILISGQGGKLNAVQKNIDNSKEINKDDILRRQQN